MKTTRLVNTSDKRYDGDQDPQCKLTAKSEAQKATATSKIVDRRPMNYYNRRLCSYRSCPLNCSLPAAKRTFVGYKVRPAESSRNDQPRWRRATAGEGFCGLATPLSAEVSI